jgi:peptidyl-dipeptidase Dcp
MQKQSGDDQAERKNPLLDISALPNYAPDFISIREDDYLPAVKAAIKEAKSNIEAIKNNKDAPDFKNTIVGLEIAAEALSATTSIFYNQLSAAGTDGLHALAEEIGPLTAEFSNDVALDDKLFEKVKHVYDEIENGSFSPEEKTLIENSYQQFVRGGALLDDAGKEELRKIDQRLSVLSPTFMNNVNKSAEKFELIIDDEDELAGIPETAKEGAKLAAKERGHENKWLFTLDFPSYLPVIQYSDNQELRKKIWHAFNSRAWNDEFDNSETVMEIVKLRDQRAKLLGYETHADFVLERRMAEAPDKVWLFLNKLKDVYKPSAKEELRELQEFANSCGEKQSLQPWDIPYYIEKMKQEKFKFSSEDLRPYFELKNVLNGCFEHFEKLLGITFEKSDKYSVWHQDVTAYEIFDKNNKEFLGTLYADFHPRIGKKDGAWKTSYRDQGLYNNKIERPVVAIVCNFTKPTEDTPSLLTHNEVLTLFHEMGHAIHAILSHVTYSSLAGTNVKWDFVELPSQVQENWAYTKETLNMFAKHYKTGELIPEKLISKLNESKNFMVGWSGLRQINFATLDMEWHTRSPETIKNVTEFEDEVTKDTSLFDRLAGPSSNAFGHLFAGGYSAGYYSYKWAEVLDADAFELFKETGLYNSEAADKYKKEILYKGGSEHPALLYKNFRGRDADPDALLRREGLI